MQIVRFEYKSKTASEDRFYEIHLELKGSKLRLFTLTGKNGEMGSRVRLNGPNKSRDFEYNYNTDKSEVEKTIGRIVQHKYVRRKFEIAKSDFIKPIDKSIRTYKIEFTDIWDSLANWVGTPKISARLSEKQKEYKKWAQAAQDNNEEGPIIRSKKKVNDNEYVDPNTGEAIKYEPFKLTPDRRKVCYLAELKRLQKRLGLIDKDDRDELGNEVQWVGGE